MSLDRPSDALAQFQAVLARVPQHVEARINCGFAQAALGSPERALAEFDPALALAPGHPGASYNRGVALIKLGRYDEAVAANDARLAVEADHANAWLNRGKALAQLNRYDEAIASYGEVLAIKKDHADAHFNQALALLTLGDYRRGFADYEWRWRRTGMAPQKSRGRPLWLGEYPLARKTVLLHAEQGLGDTIQFARYVPMLAAAGAKVVLEVQAELKPLMARLDGAATVIARGEAPPTIRRALSARQPAARVEDRTGDGAGANSLSLGRRSASRQMVGADRRAAAAAHRHRLVGQCQPRQRSQPLDRFRAPCAAVCAKPAASFISVQRDVRAEDAAALAAESRVTHVGAELEDFSDTAAVLALCDLVIAVDTAAAHLAGAMGRPVWVLLPFAPDWRWTLQGETTPWYPTARLFRQTALEDWDGVIARVGAELARL